jgi:uncharacterized protein YjbI with pentapeptide repeats
METKNGWWRAFLVVLGVPSVIFGLFQLYLERKINSIQANGIAWQLADPKTHNDLAIKWALIELSHCHKLDGLHYTPHDKDDKNKYPSLVPDEFIEKQSSSWDQCREDSFNFPGTSLQRESSLDIFLCTDEKHILKGLVSNNRSAPTITNSNFLCVSLPESNLANISVTSSRFIGSSFRNTDLSGSIWKDSDLRYAEFHNANLTNSNFTHSKLDGANFTCTTLIGVKFMGARLDGTEVFENADVSNADMSGLDGLTEKQLQQFCVQSLKLRPRLPRHLVEKATLIKTQCAPERAQRCKS